MESPLSSWVRLLQRVSRTAPVCRSPLRFEHADPLPLAMGIEELCPPVYRQRLPARAHFNAISVFAAIRVQLAQDDLMIPDRYVLVALVRADTFIETEAQHMDAMRAEGYHAEELKGERIAAASFPSEAAVATKRSEACKGGSKLLQGREQP